MWRNQIAKLPEYTEFGCGWFGVSFFHLCRVAELKSHANHFFFCFSQDSYGMAVYWIGPPSLQGSFLSGECLDAKFCRTEIDSALLFGAGQRELAKDFVAGGCFTTTWRDYRRLPRPDGGRWHPARVD